MLDDRHSTTGSWTLCVVCWLALQSIGTLAWGATGGILAPVDDDRLPVTMQSADISVDIHEPWKPRTTRHIGHRVRAVYHFTRDGPGPGKVILAVPCSVAIEPPTVHIDGVPVAANSLFSPDEIVIERDQGLKPLIWMWLEEHPEINAELAKLTAVADMGMLIEKAISCYEPSAPLPVWAERLAATLGLEAETEARHSLIDKHGLDVSVAHELVNFATAPFPTALRHLACALYPGVPFADSELELAYHWGDEKVRLNPDTGRLEPAARKWEHEGLSVGLIQLEVDFNRAARQTITVEYLVAAGPRPGPTPWRDYFQLLLKPARYWWDCGEVTVRFNVPGQYARVRFLPEPHSATVCEGGYIYEYRFVNPRENVYGVFIYPDHIDWTFGREEE